jgi:hypothetical protein
MRKLFAVAILAVAVAGSLTFISVERPTPPVMACDGC